MHWFCRTFPGAILLLAPLCAFGQTAFIDATEKAGIAHQYRGHQYGGGVACGDFDGDGYLDLFVPDGRQRQNRLYLNNRDGTFTEAAAAAGLADVAEGVGVVCGDVDNDGDLDLYVANYTTENALYLNDGAGHFTDVAAAAGVGDPGPGSGVAMADYNRDGFLDIYVLNRSEIYSSIFYKNNGDGTFTEVTAETGTGVKGMSLGVGFFDYDADGDQDLLVVDEFDPDHLFRNNGDGTFTDVSAAAGMLDSDGMGVDFPDYDNDGDFDIYIGDYYNDPLLRNNGDGTFTNAAAEAGMENPGIAWGINFMDYDNDGDRDVYVINGAMGMTNLERPNVFFENTGAGKYIERTADVGLLYVGDGRGSVCADFNRDGYPDVFFVCVYSGTSRLFLNKGGTRHWINLRLIGTKSNHSAVGARVEVQAGALRQVDEVRAGSSYASMHPLELDFGLGNREIIDRIAIDWPSGTRQILRNVAADQVLTVQEPAATGVEDSEAASGPATFVLLQNYPNPFNPATELRYALPETGVVSLRIFNVAGRLVHEMRLGRQRAGVHIVRWHGRTLQGRPLPSGIYFYRLQYQHGSTVQRSPSRKMVLVR